MKARWLNRTLTFCAYYYCLCTTEKQFYAELKRLGILEKDWPSYISNAQSHATTHTFVLDNKAIAIVCLEKQFVNYKGVEIAALLVHEAVHIWQKHAVRIGSFNDHGDEEEAYAIQSISQELMTSFIEQTRGDKE